MVLKVTTPSNKRSGPRQVADIALAGLVILVVAMMIVPLPTWGLDILIAANLSASVAIEGPGFTGAFLLGMMPV